jgi:hypothetical protein
MKGNLIFTAQATIDKNQLNQVQHRTRGKGRPYEFPTGAYSFGSMVAMIVIIVTTGKKCTNQQINDNCSELMIYRAGLQKRRFHP